MDDGVVCEPDPESGTADIDWCRDDPSALWRVLGLALSVLTLGVVFFLAYDIFFDRKNHLNRKALRDWLRCNALPSPAKLGPYTHWFIGAAQITLVGGKHYAFLGSDNVLCSFTGGWIDRRMFNQTQKILEAAQ